MNSINKLINDPSIFDYCYFYSTYADNTTFFVKNKQSIKGIVQVFQVYYTFSSLVTNFTKWEVTNLVILRGSKVAVCDIQSINLNAENYNNAWYQFFHIMKTWKRPKRSKMWHWTHSGDCINYWLSSTPWRKKFIAKQFFPKSICSTIRLYYWRSTNLEQENNYSSQLITFGGFFVTKIPKQKFWKKICFSQIWVLMLL